MKHQSIHARAVKFLLLSVAFGVFFSAFASAARAQTTTFAQFVERNGTQDFVFTNNGGANASFQTISGGSPVFFFYSNITGLDSSLQGLQFARLTVTTTTTTAPATLSGGDLDQPLNQTIIIRIIRDTPAPVGNNSRTNLLSVIIAPNTSSPDISGSNLGTSATFSATTPSQSVTFLSDFVSFIPTTQRDLGLSFSSVQPSLSLGAGNFLQSFTAAGTGTFASNPVPGVALPTAASVSISGRVLTTNGRGLRGARVNVVGANGDWRTVTTNSFGYYSIPNVEAGQTVVLSVDSKRYSFSPQVLSVSENISDVNFIAQ